ncbi:energy-coupling factor transporter ATPase [Mycoplasmatota bacterium]|nr:energy-coupling factor transporter ATPase [Mycoplasmatota bacterium]
MNHPIIKVNDLYFSYDNKNLAINKLSLEIYEREWVCILGHNGSGKSTLSKLIIGLLVPLKGTVEVNDKVLSEDTVYDIRRDIGIVFQNPDNQFVGSTVLDDIAFGMENQQISRKEMKNRIDKFIKKVKMQDFLSSEPHMLSGGQKQRVAIAGALALDSKVLFLDESTSMLDPQGRDDIVSLIKELKTDGEKTIVSITHDINEAMLADRIIVMKNGQVVASGLPEDILQDEALMKDCGLDIPMTVKLSNKLKDYDIFDKLYVKEEDLVNSLWEYNLKK